MKSLVILTVVCAILLQLDVKAQETTTPSASSTTTQMSTTTLSTAQPRRRISVQQYKPKAQEFLTNLDSINSQMFSLRRTEPSICEAMRKYLNQNLKLFHEYIFKESKRFMATAQTSRSSDVSDAVATVRNADTKAIADLATLATKLEKEINEKCANLSSVQTLSEINQKVDELRFTQLGNATELAALPQSYENEMQSNYVPVENIIGTQ